MWQVRVTGAKRDELEEKLDEAAEAYWPSVNPNAIDEAKEQFEAGKEAALALADFVQTGVDDEEDKDFLNVLIRGHANPGHKLGTNARESVSVQVSGAV